MDSVNARVIAVPACVSCTPLVDCLGELPFPVACQRGDLQHVPECDPDLFILLLQSVTDHRRDLFNLFHRFHAIPVLVLFGDGAENWDDDLIRRCDDFTRWPCPADELAYRLQRIAHVMGWVRGGESVADPGDTLVEMNLIGRSSPVRQASRQIRRFARTDAPVLVHGETGTGKELAARGIHYNSTRRDRPFVTVNCGALPDHLIENELFGHEKGAYTDASTRHAGLVEQAEGGTLFLDEVQALGAHAQAALLRFLEDGRYRPLGGQRDRDADVRVVAASNDDLAARAEQGTFRSDLHYRLHVLALWMAPLRERDGDIPLLAEHFMEMFRVKYAEPGKYLGADALAAMHRYPWPGNVREFENRLHRGFVLSETEVVSAGDVFNDLQLSSAPFPQDRGILTGSFQQAKARAIETFEVRYLREALKASGGNVSAAARSAGKERRAFGKLLKKHGLDTGAVEG